MRHILGFTGLLLTTLLVGCGQSGNLQLTSDPNYDKRARYLLHPNVDLASQTQGKNAQAAQQTAASEVNEIQ
ncbi:hypothetical protein [Acinetobacter rudis]|uniref:hypothetical protein n=1 Tax=Acinetobacter rudis TaxID=632955 RepID=UPI00334247F4